MGLFANPLKLLRRVSGGERFEGHHDYCDVFNDEYDGKGLTLTGKPCNEDCAKHCGSKVLLGEFGTIRN